MTRYWDFRTILEVDPVNDQRCVAINKTTGKRCGIGGQWIGRSNLERAGKILDEMDRTESLSECRANLDELARVMVCGHPHRKSQGVLDDRVKRWNRTIATYVASRSRESVRPKVFPLVASSRDIVFGGRNEDLVRLFCSIVMSDTDLNCRRFHLLVHLNNRSRRPCQISLDTYQPRHDCCDRRT